VVRLPPPLLLPIGLLLAGCVAPAVPPPDPALHLDDLAFAREGRDNVTLAFTLYNLDANRTAAIYGVWVDAFAYPAARANGRTDHEAGASSLLPQPAALVVAPLAEERIEARQALPPQAPGGYFQVAVTVHYVMAGSSLPSTFYITPCLPRDDPHGEPVCPATYRMARKTGSSEPLPGSPYWRERIEAARAARGDAG